VIVFFLFFVVIWLVVVLWSTSFEVNDKLKKRRKSINYYSLFLYKFNIAIYGT